MKNKTARKVALGICVVLILALGSLGAVWAENYYAAHPLPVEAEAVDPSAEETETVIPVGSTDLEPVRFSLAPGFYDVDSKLALSAEGAEKILYTRDGSDPREDGRVYRNPITLNSTSDTKIYTISACAEYADGTQSEPVTRSYIVGDDISNRFDCLVFSVSIDPDYLYNYDDGIFILGKMRDDYLATNPTREIQPTDPANWNQRGRAGERPAFVEVFEYDGTCVVSQNCGLRIFGGWSRANDQKNLRLYARSEYDETDNRFRYEFFPDALDSQGNKIVSYKKLSLRACANDNGYLFARDDAISGLAEATGLEVKKSRPAAVFLNGEYYGFAWLQQVFSEDLLDHKYNVEDGEWDILKGCEYMMIEDEDDPDWAEKNLDWRMMYDYAYKDLTDDETYAELCEMLDIDNFLTYYAFESYVGNGDWPTNNYKVFRYKNGSVPKSDQPPFDGKWRFMLYDTDFALGLYGHDFLTKHMQDLFNEKYFGQFPEDWRNDVHDKSEQYSRSDLLISLCKRDDVRERFLEILCGISGYYLNAERTADYLDEYHNWRLHELVAASEEGKAGVWGVMGELENAKNWIEKRPYAAKLHMSKVFPDYCSNDETFTVVCPPTEGAVINLGTANITAGGAGFDGWFFSGREVKLGCTLEEGARFQRWEINGSAVLDRDTVISDQLYGSEIEIKLVVAREGGIKIYETAYKGSAGGDYIVIKNYGKDIASTSGLVLSDGSNEFVLPTMNLSGGQTVRLIGKNYSKMDALGTVELGFNLKEGETVTLKNQNGDLLSSVELRQAHRRTALRLDPFAGRYIEVSCNYTDRRLEAELPQWGGWGWWG